MIVNCLQFFFMFCQIVTDFVAVVATGDLDPTASVAGDKQFCGNR